MPWRRDGLLSNHRVSTVFDLRPKIGLFVTFMDTFFTVLGLMGCLELGSNSTTRTVVRLSGAPHVSLIDFNCFTSQRKIFCSHDENSNCRQRTSRLSVLLCIMVFQLEGIFIVYTWYHMRLRFCVFSHLAAFYKLGVLKTFSKLDHQRIAKLDLVL